LKTSWLETFFVVRREQNSCRLLRCRLSAFVWPLVVSASRRQNILIFRVRTGRNLPVGPVRAMGENPQPTSSQQQSKKTKIIHATERTTRRNPQRTIQQ
jgi:hypothetical protein